MNSIGDNPTPVCRRRRIKTEKRQERIRQDVDVLDLAFPDRQNLPTFCCESLHIFRIAVDIPLEFGPPEISPRLRNASLRAS